MTGTTAVLLGLRRQEDDRWYWKGDYLSTSQTPRSYIWMSELTKDANELSDQMQKTTTTSCLINGCDQVRNENSCNDGTSTESSSVASDWRNNDFIDNKRCSTITPTDRKSMLSWCHQILKYCQMMNFETIEMIASYVDRYCWISYRHHVKQIRRRDSSQNHLDEQPVELLCCQPSQYQLVTIACLYTAIKLHESHAMHPRTLVKLSNYRFTEQQIIDTEMHILFTLNWKMNPPTVGCFIRNAVEKLEALLDQKVSCEKDDVSVGGGSEATINYVHLTYIARNFAQDAILDYNIVSVKSSVVAYCCILNAFQALLDKSISSCTLRENGMQLCLKSHLAKILDLVPTDPNLRLLQEYLYNRTEATFSSHSFGSELNELIQRESHVHTTFSPTTVPIENNKLQGTTCSKNQIQSLNKCNRDHCDEGNNQERIQSSHSKPQSPCQPSDAEASAVIRTSKVLDGNFSCGVTTKDKGVMASSNTSKSYTTSPQCISISPPAPEPTSSSSSSSSFTTSTTMS